MRVALIARAAFLAAFVLASAAPADAALVGSAGTGLVVSDARIGAHNVGATLSAESTPTGLGYSVVTFNCKVVAAPDPASTGVDVCSVNGVSAAPVPNNVPGAVSVAAGVVIVPTGSTASGCVQGRASFIEDRLGPAQMTTPLRCSPLILVTV